MSAAKPTAGPFLQACKSRQIRVATAESCTGGMIISLMTDLPGSSSMVDRGFVTYSNAAKVEMLGVSPETLENHGAVSREIALEMAAGALQRSRADIAIAVTGIAGPDGGSQEKPVGLVWFAVAATGRASVAEHRLFEDKGRDFVRRQAAETALQIALATLEGRQGEAGFP